MQKNNFLLSLLLLSTITTLLPDQAQHKEISEKDRKLFKAAQEGDVETVREYMENNEYCDGTDAEENNLFHIAAKHGRTEIIEELTRDLGWWKTYVWGPSLPDINQKNKDEDTPLHCASNAGHTETAKTLIEKQADIKILNKEKKSAVFAALKKDNTPLVQAFIVAGLDPASYKNNGVHMFHYAIAHHANNTVQYFAQQKTLLNQSGKDGIKPIHVAAKSNNAIALDILLFYGAEINATDDNGNTAGHWSAQHGTEQIMAKLLQQPAFDINIANKAGNDLLAAAVSHKQNNIINLLFHQIIPDINKTRPDGSTYAMIAAREGNNKALELFVNRNCNLTSTDNQGRNILHILANTNNYDGAQLILKKERALLSATDNDGNQPLFTAMWLENPKMAQLYIECGAPLITINSEGDSIIHHAVKCKKTVLIKQLISRGAPIIANPRNGLYFYHYLVDQEEANALKEFKKIIRMDTLLSEGDNILHYALKKGKRACAHELLDSAFIHHQNNAGHTPAIIAAQQNMACIIRELKNRNVDLAILDNHGSGIVHHAAAYGSVDVLKQLAEYGFSFAQQTKNGNTAPHIAAINNRVPALRFFKEQGQDFSIRNDYGYTTLVAGAMAGNLEATQELLSDRAFIGNEVDDILNHLHYATDSKQKRVRNFVNQEHEKRYAESTVIEREHPNTSNIIDNNRSLLSELCQHGDIMAAVEILTYNPARAAYKTAAQIYKMDQSQRMQLRATYLQHKSDALEYQLSLQLRIKSVKEQKAQAEAKAHTDKIRAEIQERDKRIAAEQAAQRKADKAREIRERQEHEAAIKAQKKHAKDLKREQERKEQEAIRTQGQLLQQHHHNVQQNPQPNVQPSGQPAGQDQSFDMQAYLQSLNPSAPPIEEDNKNEDQASDSQENKETCVICYHPKELVHFTCGNNHGTIVCKECLDTIKTKKNVCPMCRGELK